MTTKKPAPKVAPRPPKSAVVAPEEPVIDRAKQRRPWYIALLVCGVVVLGTAAALAMSGTLYGQEARLFRFINHAFLPNWLTDQVARPISDAMWGIVILVIALLAVPKFRLRAWQYVVAGGATYVSTIVVEQIVDRARPIALSGYDVIARATQDGPGFPSTHVAVITALGLTIWPYVNWFGRAGIVLLVTAEAWSRLFLGVHAPLDVAGGAALAMVVVGLIHLTPANIRTFFRVSA